MRLFDSPARTNLTDLTDLIRMAACAKFDPVVDSHMVHLLEGELARVESHSDGRARVESPYARLRLWRNPFGELTREERAALAVVDVAKWLSALNNANTALQFIGEKGHGKTTHLLAIGQALPSAHYVYLPECGPQPAIPIERPLLLDEAQRLGRIARWRVFRRTGPLVLGTHFDLTRQLQGAGFHVTTVNVGGDPSPERLMSILNARIDASRLTGADVPRISIVQARKLQERFGGDIRAIESYLYDLFQAAAEKDSSWPLAI